MPNNLSMKTSRSCLQQPPDCRPQRIYPKIRILASADVTRDINSQRWLFSLAMPHI
jgi:hypothetical protein